MVQLTDEYKVILRRFKYQKQQTLGVLTVYKNSLKVFECYTLEREWDNNKKGSSCVPEGLYNVVLEYSPKFKTKLFELKNVPNRSECKFHVANYWHQLNGCIGVGDKLIDINHDGWEDTINSKNTLEKLHKVLPNNFKLRITS